MSPSDAGLAGKQVLVTGAGSGIGLEIARRFSERGAQVHIADLSEQAVTMHASESLITHVCDVSDADQVAQLFARVGAVDVLVNNAGVGGPAAAIEDVSIVEWDRTIRVNLSGMFYCIKYATPAMKAQSGGVIINISTASTHTGLPRRLPYVASKAGVEGLTRNVARELGPFGIRCNAILPGLVDNARGRALVKRLADSEGLSADAAHERFVSFVSMRTMIGMGEIADMACFLAGDLARHVTGQLISVDGNLEWET